MKKSVLLALVGFGIATSGAFGAPEPPITITSDGGAELGENGAPTTYKEKVKFECPAQNLTIECDRLAVFSTPPPQAKIQKAIATGNVVVQQAGVDGKFAIAKGEKAVFDVAAKTTTVSGAPQAVLDVGSDYLFHADTVTLQPNGKHRLGALPRTVFKKPNNEAKGR